MLIAIFYFVLGLGILIFLHELGHFAVARWCGVKVETFSIGFGPKILKWKKGETEYCLSIIPLGGYVKMLGQDDFAEEKDEKVEDPRSFAAQSLPKRMAIVFAGPAMNLILALVLMPLALMIGTRVPPHVMQAPTVLGVAKDSPAERIGLQKGDRILTLNGKGVGSWGELNEWVIRHAGETAELGVIRTSGSEEFLKVTVGSETSLSLGYLGIEPDRFLEPILDKIEPKAPADLAGLQPGDKITAVNGQKIEFSIRLGETLKETKGQPVRLEILRNGQASTVTLTPQRDPKSEDENPRWLVGVKFKIPEVEKVKRTYPVATSTFQKGVDELEWQCLMIGRVLKNLFTFQKGAADTIGGPVQIAQVSAKVGQDGIGNFMVLLASISLQLGLLNLLPIPVLDGGHLMFMTYEALRRKPISFAIRLRVQQVGMFLLLGLMVAVTFKDIANLESVKALYSRFFG